MFRLLSASFVHICDVSTVFRFGAAAQDYNGSFTVTCDGASGGSSVLIGGEATCERVPCPELTVANSDTSNATGNTSDIRVVTCTDGYGAVVDNETFGSFNTTCSGVSAGISVWSGDSTCDEVACSFLSVTNGVVPSLVDSNLGSEVTVVCDNGYNSSAGSSFVTTCIGSAPGEAIWTSELTCNAMACPDLTVANSNRNALVMFTGDSTLVSCAAG